MILRYDRLPSLFDYRSLLTLERLYRRFTPRGAEDLAEGADEADARSAMEAESSNGGGDSIAVRRVLFRSARATMTSSTVTLTVAST